MAAPSSSSTARTSPQCHVSAYLSTDHLASQPPDSVTTLRSLLDHQAHLEAEAREIMPYSFDECTYDKGPLKQSVWACQDCGYKGVCYSCSLSCHADCRLVELFQRRNFTCDCPTSYSDASPSTRPAHRCTLRQGPQPLEPNSGNRYGPNFRGEFCRCGRPYNPETENESMICCLACEDWFHESCLNLQDPSPQPSKNHLPTPPPTSSDQVHDIRPADDDDDDDEEEESPILPSRTYEHLICGSCVSKYPLLQRYAGTPGWQMVVPAESMPVEEVDPDKKGWQSRWKVIGKPVDSGKQAPCDGAPELSADSLKRKASDDAVQDHPEKKPRWANGEAQKTAQQQATTPCSIPPANKEAEAILSALAGGEDTRSARGDLFLVEGAREAICRCSKCETAVSCLPFPLEEEDVYEPPVDGEPEESIDDLTARALERLPRSQAIETVIKFNEMKEKLKAFLEPFAHGEQVVRTEDITEFMESMRSSA